MILLAVPTHATTAEVRTTYEDYQKGIFYKPDQETIEKATAIYFAKQKSKKANLGSYCNCVLWSQAHGLGVRGYGAAKNYPINSLIPSTTGFVVTYEGSSGHMARYVLDGEWLILDEDNYKECTVTFGRRLHVNSSLIKGYINW